MEQPAAMRRLRRVHAATAPDAGAMGAGSASSEVEPPKAGPEPEPRGAPKLLTDEQMKSYVMNVREHVCVAFFSSLVRLTQHVVQGYIALPVADMPPEWHDGLWQTCHDWLYRGAPDRGDRDDRLVFPAIPQLAEVTHSPTVRGALSSILGADFAQHPHRTCVSLSLPAARAAPSI